MSFRIRKMTARIVDHRQQFAKKLPRNCHRSRFAWWKPVELLHVPAPLFLANR